MKKVLPLLMLLVLLLAACPALAESAVEHMEFPESGFSYDMPAAYRDVVGQIDGPMDRGEILGYDSGIVVGYVNYRGRTDEEVAEYDAFMADALAESDEITQELKDRANEFCKRNFQLFEVYGMREGKSIDDLTQMLGANPFKTVTELGKKGDYNYWLVTYDLQYPAVAAVMESWPEEFVTELQGLLDDVAAHPERFTLKERKPSFVAPAIGSAVEFETADLDGNVVSSAELFGQSKITLVNIWRTWCEPCVEEMPRLEEIARDYADKGVAVVTYCADAEDDEMIARAKEITADFGFKTLVWSESIAAALPWKGTPTTYFVDGEGKMLGYPIPSANPEAYITSLDAYLNGTPLEDLPTIAETEAELEEKATYIVTVLDQNGDPVPKAAVSFCTPTSCSFAKADENGVATYVGAPFAYHVDIVKVPKGYSFTPLDDVYTDPHSFSMTVTVTKN